QVPDSLVPGWNSTLFDRLIEIHHSDVASTFPAHGYQHALVAPNGHGSVYQDLESEPGTVLIYSFDHQTRNRLDGLDLVIGAPGAQMDLQVRCERTFDQWRHYRGYYLVPEDQSLTRFEFRTLPNIAISGGNYLDGFKVEEMELPEPSLPRGNAASAQAEEDAASLIEFEVDREAFFNVAHLRIRSQAAQWVRIVLLNSKGYKVATLLNGWVIADKDYSVELRMDGPGRGKYTLRMDTSGGQLLSRELERTRRKKRRR
ncbi:MAG: hypothetical protein AAF570_25310, partial [Bacteroidota bacterium]